jgi:predicted acyl esterase
VTVVKQKQLNGPQTTGREYRNLSAPEHGIRHDVNVETPMRDGISLMTDVHRPDADGRFPALIAASPYPRQIQDLGAQRRSGSEYPGHHWLSARQRRHQQSEHYSLELPTPAPDPHLTRDLWSISSGQRR